MEHFVDASFAQDSRLMSKGGGRFYRGHVDQYTVAQEALPGQVSYLVQQNRKWEEKHSPFSRSAFLGCQHAFIQNHEWRFLRPTCLFNKPNIPRGVHLLGPELLPVLASNAMRSKEDEPASVRLLPVSQSCSPKPVKAVGKRPL